MWWSTLLGGCGTVSVEKWSCSRGASCVVEYTIGRLWYCLCREVVL